jgi:hypothetical protein
MVGSQRQSPLPLSETIRRDCDRGAAYRNQTPMTQITAATPTETMASASQAPLRASVKRSSMEAMRLTSRRLRPDNARLAARKAGSKICSFSVKARRLFHGPVRAPSPKPTRDRPENFRYFLASSVGAPPTGADFLPPVRSISQFKVSSLPWYAGTMMALSARSTHLPTAVSSPYGSLIVADLT